MPGFGHLGHGVEQFAARVGGSGFFFRRIQAAPVLQAQIRIKTEEIRGAYGIISSEERRGGKECEYRGAYEQETRKYSLRRLGNLE